MRRVGLAHLVAVSGLNVGMVAALLLALVYRVYTSLSTVDLDELSRAEVSREEELEREELTT